MLTPEQARDRLAVEADAELRTARLEAIEKLPDWQRRLGERLLPKERHRYDATTWRAEDLARFDAATPRVRAKLFAAVAPKLAPHLERMWQLGKERPYTRGWNSRPFRAPGDPSLTLTARFGALHAVVNALATYDADAVWVAHWADHLHWGSFGPLLAAIVDGGGGDGDRVYGILVGTANGDDEIGTMGRELVTALLSASREDGWELIERMLLAAQRQEGLRQTILESVDLAHPEAFRRMVALVADNGLTRFSSAARAIDVWFGLGFEAADRRTLDAALAAARAFLDDDTARKDALAAGPGEAAYLALWAVAFVDVARALPIAETLLVDSDPARRYAAAHLLAQIQLPDASRILATALRDEDPRVVLRALGGLGWADAEVRPMVVDELEALLDRLGPRAQELAPVLWPWTGGTLAPASVASLLVSHGEAVPLERLARHLPRMDVYARSAFAARLAGEEPRAELRSLVLELVADPAASVRVPALKAAEKTPLSEDEASLLEPLLKRKAADLRRGLVALLLNRPDDAVIASAGRLLGGDAQQRLGGLELLRRLVEEGRSAEEARRQAGAFAPRGGPSTAEQLQLDAILSARADELAELDPALGLVALERMTFPAAPRKRKATLMTRAALDLLRELDAFVHEHREQRFVVEAYGDAPPEELLGNMSSRFPYPPNPRSSVRFEDWAEHLPLAELWLEWNRTRAARDPDGLELVRAGTAVWFAPGVVWDMSDVESTVMGRHKAPAFDHPNVVAAVVAWLLDLRPPEGDLGFLLDATETVFAGVPRAQLEESPPADRQPWDWSWKSWRRRGRTIYLDRISRVLQLTPGRVSEEQWRRVWQLHLWFRDPLMAERAAGKTSGGTVDDIDLRITLGAHEAGAATDDDLILQLLAEPGEASRWSGRGGRLGSVTGRRVIVPASAVPVVERVRRRVVEVELQRGEAPTVASAHARSLRWSGGLETLAPVLARLGKEPFVRGWRYDGEGADTVFSHLGRASYPREDDTPERFAEAMREAGIPERRLVELAAFAPHWSRHVEHAVGWPGLASAVWWMHAHTKDAGWAVDEEIREVWTAQVAERTPLTSHELLDGAVDVDWFHAVHAELGAKRWAVVNDAARYCSTGTGHTRAQLFADAMIRRGAEKDLRPRIAKRQQDAVRALGLVPLPTGAKHEATVLAHYRTLQEFLRTSKQFGSQRRESEKRAVEIGMANLARTAGYVDPLRFSWAMEARGVADLADGPLTETVDGVELTLSLDAQGAPELAVARDGTPLKAVPAKLRSRKEVKELRARVTELRRQGTRVRASLEDAMVRGDGFRGRELQELARHLVVYPKLERLVLAGDGIAGYPAADGRALIDHAGDAHAVGNEEELRIAHPLDLLERGSWHEWQRDCLERQVVQPFKQVFRELYVPTPDERGADTSRRYEGNQLQPRQALALFGTRGWVASPEEGVRKTFHREGLTVGVWFLEAFFTPADVEGLTIEGLGFYRPAASKQVAIDEVPGRLFSEVMKDLDLVVSVAHAGGVDPETSSSTVEMRAALVGETAELLQLDNVRVESPWIMIDGKLGDWSVHLGSASVHRRPGGAVCIVPVHAQHLGRIFLPFADEDPKTAEVVAKALLLAKDDEIRDPTILEQLRA